MAACLFFVRFLLVQEATEGEILFGFYSKNLESWKGLSSDLERD